MNGEDEIYEDIDDEHENCRRAKAEGGIIMTKETKQIGQPKVMVGDVQATYIAQIPDAQKDEFGYPLGTMWRRCRVAGHFFVPHNSVVTIGKQLFDKNDKKKIAKARKEEEE